MTNVCPPDGDLERFLAGVSGATERKALEAHLAGCAGCQRRLGELNWGGVTLPQFAADSERAT